MRHRAAMLTDLAQELEQQAERVGVRAGERSRDLDDDAPVQGFGGTRRELDTAERGFSSRGW